ncbi:MAG: hypothetical protein WC326_15455 [Candidatus Delongbacteria bacterium]
MQTDVPKGDFFIRLGYANHHDELNQALAAAGLTRLDKPRIQLTKLDPAATRLEEDFIRVCRRGDCRRTAHLDAGNRVAVAALTPEACQICGGKALSQACDRMRSACQHAGITKLCVLGGSPKSREEIRRSLPRELDVRLVDGTATRSLKEARDDVAWADLVVIWAGTQLDHKVSGLYVAAPRRSSVARRSVQELFTHIAGVATRLSAR